MAFALRDQDAANNSGATAVLTDLAVTAGDLIIVALRERDGVNISSVADDVNGAYTAGPVAGTFGIGIWYKINSGAGPVDITATWASAPGSASIQASSWNPNGQTVTKDAENEDSSASTTSHPNGSVTLSGAGLILSNTTIYADPGSWTGTAGFTGALTTASDRHYVQYKISTGETTTSTVTTANDVGGHDGFNIAFLLSGGGGGTAVPVFVNNLRVQGIL